MPRVRDRAENALNLKLNYYSRELRNQFSRQKGTKYKTETHVATLPANEMISYSVDNRLFGASVDLPIHPHTIAPELRKMNPVSGIIIRIADRMCDD